MTFNSTHGREHNVSQALQQSEFKSPKGSTGRVTALGMICMGFALLCSVCRHMGGRKCGPSCHCEDHF